MNKLKLVWHSMKQLILVTSIAVLVLFGIQSSPGQVVLVEGSHTLTQLVDSSVTLDPSQAILDDRASIESIGVDPSTGDLYIQLAEHASIPIPFAEKSDTTHIYRVTPAGVVSPVVLDTGFGINSRGTDLHFDPVTGLLVTQDQNFAGGGPRHGGAGNGSHWDMGALRVRTKYLRDGLLGRNRGVRRTGDRDRFHQRSRGRDEFGSLRRSCNTSLSAALGRR